MRVTLCAFDAPGNLDGPTTWLKRLLPFLKDNGITVRVIFIAANSKKLSFFRELQDKGFECKLVPWELFLEEKIIAILDDLKQFPPNVFIPNYFPAACFAAYWAKQAGIPSLIVLHNDNDMHHALVDEFVAGDEEKKVSAVVAVSMFIKNKIDEKNTDGVIVEFITYGAPIPASKAIRKSSDPLKLIYAGRITEHQKRISEVTNAFCNAAREIAGTECIIYGNGDALNDVLKLIEKKGNGLPVKYGGVLDSSKVQDHFLQNHVYILLSDYEGLPISLMEAMAAGLVPVCTNIRSGIGEVIENGRNGFLVNNREEEFLDVIKKLKHSPGLWEECANAARETIINHYSLEVCNTQWLSLLQRLANSNVNPGNISMPGLQELKRINVNKEFRHFDNRMPASWRIPFYRLKKKIGRIKRAVFPS